MQKRVAFFIPADSIKPANGLGSFLQCTANLLGQHDIGVDIITDSPTCIYDRVSTDFINTLPMTTVYAPQASTSIYRYYNANFSTDDWQMKHPGLSLNYDQARQYEMALRNALHDNTYDLIIIERAENALATINLRAHETINTIYYTHSPLLMWPPEKVSAYDSLCNSLMQTEGITVATQSVINKRIIDDKLNVNSVILPMQCPERALLDYVEVEKEGALFIGAFDDRKAPLVFIDAVRTAGVKPIVITPSSHEYLWTDAFAAAGITDFEIGAGVIGDDKVELIRKAKMCYMPSMFECFPFAVIEALHSCPVIAHDNAAWIVNFVNYDGFYPTARADVADRMKELNSLPPSDDFGRSMVSYDINAEHTWINFLT